MAKSFASCVLHIRTKMSKLDWWLLLLVIATLCVSVSGRHKKNRTMDVKFKILVTDPNLPQDAMDLLTRGSDVVVCKSVPPKRSEILQKVVGVNGILWASHYPLDAEILEAAGTQLKSISTMSADVDFVDLVELQRRKIQLGHTTIAMNEAVAELAIGLMIAAARRFHEGREKIAASRWEHNQLHWMGGQDIRDACVGFYGFGGIGQAIASRLMGFDIGSVLYTSRRRVESRIQIILMAKKVPFDELLAKSDILFITGPLTSEIVDVFDMAAFRKMKKNAVLVNVARGKLVNHNDLYTALRTKRIFAAGLDVMTPEPLPSNHRLLSLPNCVILPHLGSATERTRTDMAVIAVHNVLRGLVGEKMVSPIY